MLIVIEMVNWSLHQCLQSLFSRPGPLASNKLAISLGISVGHRQNIGLMESFA